MARTCRPRPLEPASVVKTYESLELNNADYFIHNYFGSNFGRDPNECAIKDA